MRKPERTFATGDLIPQQGTIATLLKMPIVRQRFRDLPLVHYEK
jgi:hypothetical protein